jgi:hypothetical protein
MTHLPGYPVLEGELVALGFAPHELQFDPGEVLILGGIGVAWTTLGDVPDAAGLYAFTIDDGRRQNVAYVGRTSHLWMVTKGRLPHSAGARPGQRYGRPKYAGGTRQRVNVLVAAEVAAGRRVRHWLRPLAAADLAGEEERLIQLWRLRQVGWNRG